MAPIRLIHLLAASPILLAACSSGPTVLTHDNGEVALRIESTVDGVSVENMRVRLRDNQATAQFNLVNDDSDRQNVFVALEWYDSDGFLLEDSMEVDPRERTFNLRGGKQRTLTFFSPDGQRPTTLRCTVEESEVHF